MRTAGAEQAHVLVIAVDEVDQSVAIAATAKAHFPQLQIVARARYVQPFFRLRELGITLTE